MCVNFCRYNWGPQKHILSIFYLLFIYHLFIYFICHLSLLSIYLSVYPVCNMCICIGAIVPWSGHGGQRTTWGKSLLPTCGSKESNLIIRLVSKHLSAEPSTGLRAAHFVFTITVSLNGTLIESRQERIFLNNHEDHLQMTGWDSVGNLIRVNNNNCHFIFTSYMVDNLLRLVLLYPPQP